MKIFSINIVITRSFSLVRTTAYVMHLCGKVYGNPTETFVEVQNTQQDTKVPTHTPLGIFSYTHEN